MRLKVRNIARFGPVAPPVQEGTGRRRREKRKEEEEGTDPKPFWLKHLLFLHPTSRCVLRVVYDGR